MSNDYINNAIGDLQSANDEWDNLEAERDELQSDLETANEKIAELEARIEELEGDTEAEAETK